MNAPKIPQIVDFLIYVATMEAGMRDRQWRDGDRFVFWTDWGDPNKSERHEVMVYDAEKGIYVTMIDGRAQQIEVPPGADVYQASLKMTQNLIDLAEASWRPDGVIVEASKVSDYIHDQLSWRENDEPDYHPGSNNTVRNIVHPSLYAHVRPDAENIAEDHPVLDRFGRPFELSKYQWLPAEVDVDKNLKGKFVSPINNFTQDSMLLEPALNEAIPLLQKAYEYVKNYHPWDEHSDERDPGEYPHQTVSFAGKRLQIITKIVEYDLSDCDFEGVWHVEGMSHEHIVATAVLTLYRGSEVLGGELNFKRAPTEEEASYFAQRVNSSNLDEVGSKLVATGSWPLGRVKTERHDWVVFPNSHIHRLSKLTTWDRYRAERDGQPPPQKEPVTGRNRWRSWSLSAKRRVLVFWLVDPAERITSTQDIPNPQANMTLEQAKVNRLELMAERKLHKEKLNLRAVSLCEH